MKRTGVRLLAICISCLMMILVVEPVRATTISDLEKQQEEINKKKQEAEQKKKEEQQRYDTASGKVSSIQSEVDDISDEIDEVDESLVEIIASVEMITDEIAVKEEQIEETTKEYEEAKAVEDAQYDAMKVRIKYLYEKGDATYLQLLLESSSIGEMVNRAEYIEKLYDYDRKLLEEYQQARQKTEELKIQLENEHDELQAQQHELEEEQAGLEEILAQKQALFDDYSNQLTKAKQEAAVYKANIKKQNDEIKRLQQESSKKQSEIDAAKKAQEEAKKAQEAALSRESGGNSGGSGKSYASASSYSGSGSKGQQIANYACQFIGNPYVPGGTSLTEGADCSGFVWRVYKDFGYSVPRTSGSLRSAGTGVSYAEAQPGDIMCYAGHVGIYIGNGQIVHASTQRTGIKITAATYREILAVRRIV